MLDVSKRFEDKTLTRELYSIPQILYIEFIYIENGATEPSNTTIKTLHSVVAALSYFSPSTRDLPFCETLLLIDYNSFYIKLNLGKLFPS